MTRKGGTMSIGEVADATGLSTHTLRYYEEEGLLPQVTRNDAGHRRYRDEHIRWVGLLERLRVSGMSIARMRHYVALAVRGDETASERKALLEEHETDIRARIAELEECRTIVRAKIDLYAGRLDDISVVWKLVDKARRKQSDGASAGLRTGRP